MADFDPTIMDSLPPLRDVLQKYDLIPKKSLGQNFLLDQNVTDKIVSLALNSYNGDTQDLHVIEVGPGPGGLTRSILRAGAKKVSAIEFDERAISALTELKKTSNHLNIYHEDALKTDFSDIVDQSPTAIIANLPYNIATPLLIKWLKYIHENPGKIAFMALMFQKEVAERIIAAPKQKTYGRLSVLSQWLCDAQIVYNLPPDVFTPPPKIWSSIVKLTPKQSPADIEFKDLEHITAQAFGQRRKMIRKSLKNYIELIENMGLDPMKRAEDLSVEEYIKLCSKL